MKLVLDASVFDMQGRDVDLLTLFQAGTTARFRIAVAEAATKSLDAWLAGQTSHSAEYCRDVLELAMVSEATEPSRIQLDVVAAVDATRSGPSPVAS
jgi:hypothetical protein